MAGASGSNNLARKLVFWMFNRVMNNTYVVYTHLVSREGGRVLPMGKVVRELAHGLCQRREPIRKMATTHPSHLQDMDRVERHQTGIKICSDRKKYVELPPIKPTLSLTRRSELTQQKKKQPWRCHQSLSAATRGRCSWARCPGINKSKAKRKRAYTPFM